MRTPASPGDPRAEMRRLLDGYRVTQALAVVARLGVADLLADGPRPVEALAEETGAQAGPLYRVLRALAAVGVFAEVAPRQFALTPLAETLRDGQPGSLRSMAIYHSGDPYQAWAGLMYSVQTGEPAFDQVFGAPHFTYMATHPESSAAFDAAMSGNSSASATAIAAAYDFPAASVVVDVGGGHGIMLAAVLRAHPGLRGVLFDQPHVVAGALSTLEEAGVAARCERVGGDFFTPPLPAGDLYLLRQIIHDWDDERSVAILRACAQAMGSASRLLLIESLMPAGPAPYRAAFLDLQMMVMNGGRQRTLEEYTQLFTAAGLRLTRVIPTSSDFSLIEAARAEEA